MTSGVIVLNIPLDVVNSVGTTAYAGTLGSLNGQFHDSTTGVTVTWQITQPPTFTKDQGFAWLSTSVRFIVITQPGDDSASATGTATIECDASGSDEIRFSFTIKNLTFASTDLGLQILLQANSQGISDNIQNVLDACTYTLGPIGNLVFAGVNYDTHSVAGEAAVIVTGCMDISDVSNIPYLDQLNDPGSVVIGCDAAFAKKVLDAIFWPTVTKQWSVGAADISLDSYDASFSNGALQLSLSTSGKVEVAGARWKLDIDTVQITATPAFDGVDTVVIGDISVSKPGIKAKPDNFLAWLYGTFGGTLLSIFTAVVNSFVSGQIRDGLKTALCQEFFELPSPSGSVSAYTIGLKAQNVSFGYSDNWPFIVKGGLAVTVDPTYFSAPLIDSFVDGQVFPYPGDIPMHGLGVPNAQVHISINGQALPQTPTVGADGTWDYGSYTGYNPSWNTLSITQSLGSLSSEAGTHGFFQLGAPAFTSPTSTSYTAGVPISVMGTATNVSSSTVSVFLDDNPLPNNPVAVWSGQWNYGSIRPDAGPHTLTVKQTLNNVDSPLSPALAIMVNTPPLVPEPKFSFPPDGYNFYEDQGITAQGTATPQASVQLSIDNNPIPQGPTTADFGGNWAFSHIPVSTLGAHVLSVIQTVDGNDSEPATRQITVIATNTALLPMPGFNTPSEGQIFWFPQTVSMSGTAQASATVTVSANGKPLSNGPTTADPNGNWAISNVPFDVGSITLTAVQSADGVSSQPAQRDIVMRPGG